MKPVYFPYKSLEDFVASRPLSIDGVFDDGWGAPVTLKGIETEAAVLFADIASFTQRTAELTPTETLAFVNTFFTWITAEALRGSRGIIDKYIGDEVMIVYSKEFGSEDPFVDALRAAREFCEHDVLVYEPRIGIASGPVTIGFVGTPVRYNCSVFGRTVNIAKRCASVPSAHPLGYSIVFPADHWKDRELADVFPPEIANLGDGKEDAEPSGWDLGEARTVEVKNFPPLQVLELHNPRFRLTTFDTVERARSAVHSVQKRKTVS